MPERIVRVASGPLALVVACSGGWGFGALAVWGDEATVAMAAWAAEAGGFLEEGGVRWAHEKLPVVGEGAWDARALAHVSKQAKWVERFKSDTPKSCI